MPLPPRSHTSSSCRPIAATDALSHTTRTYYDGLDRTLTVVANLTGQAITVTTVPAYSSADPDQNVRAFTSYDKAGRVLETRDNAGLVTRNTYDAVGRTLTTTVNYSATGPVDDTTNLATGTVYDKLGTVTRSIDAEGVTTGFDYDWAGRLITVTENLVVPGATTVSQNVRTIYAYDGHGNRLTITDGKGHVTTFTYDALDRQRTEQDALGNTWTTTYTKVGLTTSLLDANGQTTGYAYDGLRRVTGIDYPAGTADVSFTYDALGNRTTMTDGTGVTSWALDALNRPITITAPSGAVGYGYDRLGNRTQLRYPDTKAVTYTVDALNRIATVQDWASAFTSYTYNAAGQVLTTTLPNGVRTVYGYDAAQRLQGLAHSTTTQTLGAYTYTVNAAGNRTAVTESFLQDGPPLNVVDPIFANGFENGTTLPGAWSGTTGTGVVVTTTTPITGTYSLLVTPSGTTARYITDTLPTAESRYRARFFFSTSALTMPTTITHTLFAAYSGTSTVTDTVSLQLRKLATGSYQLRAGSRLDSGALQQTGWVTITNGIHWAEVDWQAATAAGANNGKLDWWVDSAGQSGLTGQDSDTRRIDSARLGVVAVAGSGTVSGSYRFDAFESRRATGPIGNSPVLPDALFGDSFETGATAYWQTVSAAGSAVTTTAAMLGNLGLSVPLTGTTTAKYLEDPTPGSESRYRARLFFDVNALTMTTATSHTVLVGYTTNTSTPVLEVALRRNGSNYELRVHNRNTASVWSVSPWVVITDDKHRIELDWQAGTTGSLAWWIDGAAQTGPAATNNSTRRIDIVRIGAVSGVDTSTRGSFFLDGFESHRSSAIGLPVSQAMVTTAITYGYDPLYRLTSAAYSDGTLFGYAYDAVGNVLTKTQTISGTPATQTYAYDDANRQTSAAGLAQTYDNNGNLLNDGATAYTWDGANRMTASGSTAYTYNGLNDRVSAGGVTHQLDLNAGLTQVLADGTNTYLYGAGRLGEQQGTAWQYHLADGLGSVRQLANASGVVSVAKGYEPYGEVLSSAGSASSVYGFTGEQMDTSGKLVYLRARYYQTEKMRFASRDTWTGDPTQPRSYNRWGYAYANVVNWVDPSGYVGCWQGSKAEDCQNAGLARAAAPYRIWFTAEKTRIWKTSDKAAIIGGTRLVANRFSRLLALMGRSVTPREAYLKVYGSVNWYRTSAALSGGAYCQRLDANSGLRPGLMCSDAGDGRITARLATHELGHVFNAEITNRITNGFFDAGVVSPYTALFKEGIYAPDPKTPGGWTHIGGEIDNETECSEHVLDEATNTLKCTNFYYRTSSGYAPGTQSNFSVSANEDFADMFSNWVMRSFDSSPNGAARNAWVERHMIRYFGDIYGISMISLYRHGKGTRGYECR